MDKLEERKLGLLLKLPQIGKMKDKIDEKLTKMLNEDVYIPQKITNRIRTTLKEEKKGVWSKMKLKKIVAPLLGVLIVGTSVVFAGKVYFDKINSIQEAEENRYFETVHMDYVENAGLGIKIDNYFIDSNRVGVTISLQADEEISSAELYNTTLTESKTYSEVIDGQTYIHFDESESGREFNRRRELLKFFDQEGNEVKPVEESGYGSSLGEYESLDNHTIRTLYTVPLHQEVIPDTMKITIKRVVAFIHGNTKEYIGNWDFEIPIAEKFKQKNNTLYEGTVNLENVIVEKAELSATKLRVTLKADDLHKLYYGPNGDQEKLYGYPRLFGEEGAYNEQDIHAEELNSYETNQIILKFDISKFSAENSYTITLGEMVITLTKK